ncbi:MAG: hypothetical protein IKT02_06640, partial [Bacteroidales bacterium]|nr:hypothetical protein [Bacteroidales bacterium]
MKKFFKLFSLVLFVTVLFGGSYALNAQKSVIAESQDVEEGGSSSSELINADFEIGRDGEKVAQTYAAAGYDFFTTWSSAPGGAE